MLKRILVFAAAAAVFSLPATAQTVDEIIAKHVAARGGMDKLKAVKSVRMTGHLSSGGMEIPTTLENKRPELVRMEFTVQGLVGIQAYDGTVGWQVMPFMGKKDPEPMSADDLKDIQEQADSIDGPMVDYKAKGNQVELIGKEKIEGSDCYVLKVTLKNGTVNTDYMDTESFLVIKETAKKTVRGTEVETESTLGDYKEVEGIIFPFVVEGGIKGSPQKQRIVIEKIELNPAIDDARFKMPAPAPVAADPKPAEAKPPQP